MKRAQEIEVIDLMIEHALEFSASEEPGSNGIAQKLLESALEKAEAIDYNFVEAFRRIRAARKAAQ